MFDLSSTKLLILAVVALLVVGPKDFPILLRTIGKYLGIIRRQADEFRTQFNDAMRESELDTLKKDLETVSQDVEKTIRDAEADVERDIATANAQFTDATRLPSLEVPPELAPPMADVTVPPPPPLEPVPVTTTAAPPIHPADVPAKAGA